jgi:hypothetical protein
MVDSKRCISALFLLICCYSQTAVKTFIFERSKTKVFTAVWAIFSRLTHGQRCQGNPQVPPGAQLAAAVLPPAEPPVTAKVASFFCVSWLLHTGQTTACALWFVVRINRSKLAPQLVQTKSNKGIGSFLFHKQQRHKLQRIGKPTNWSTYPNTPSAPAKFVIKGHANKFSKQPSHVVPIRCSPNSL